jgi:hypothetical protein
MLEAATCKNCFGTGEVADPDVDGEDGLRACPFCDGPAAFIAAAKNAMPALLACVEALDIIANSLVCGPTDYAEHNARELLRAGNIARAALSSFTAALEGR